MYVSIQRELSSTIREVRYFGHRGKSLLRQYDLNELNITNGCSHTGKCLIVPDCHIAQPIPG